MTDVERIAGRVVLLHEGRALLDRSLDALRESHCVALVSFDPAVSRARLLGLEGCLGARQLSRRRGRCQAPRTSPDVR